MLGALASILTVWLVTGVLVFEAINRIITPEPVNGKSGWRGQGGCVGGWVAARGPARRVGQPEDQVQAGCAHFTMARLQPTLRWRFPARKPAHRAPAHCHPAARAALQSCSSSP